MKKAILWGICALLGVGSMQAVPGLSQIPRSESYEELEVDLTGEPDSDRVKLDVSHSMIRGLSIYRRIATKFPNLEELNMSHNDLVWVSPVIRRFKDLRVLNLGHNKLKHLGRPLTELENLEVLRLSHNDLASLPMGFGNLKKLRVLDLSDNKFTLLPREMGKLKETLKFLYLKGNPLDGEKQKKIKEMLPYTDIVFK